MPRRDVDPAFGRRLRELIQDRGLSYRALANRTHHGKSYLHDLAAGRRAPTPATATRLDDALGAGGELAALADPGRRWAGDDELDALELARRVEASDVSAETLRRLERAVDDLAMAYATTPPDELLHRAREHLRYLGRLLDGRATLAQRRRLLVAGGWLSLLAATAHVDLRQRAADARLATADAMAEHAEYAEIRAWCAETRAWQALTGGDYRRAVDLSQLAQGLAPRGSSARIQATAQEGRAWARMGEPRRTRQVLDRVAQLTSPLARPEHPEHHYVYDPDKALSYTATTLAWVGDPAAEEYARAVVRRLEAAPDGVVRPRRVATARLDLALALAGSGRPDEAAAVAEAAVASGRVVPSAWWRAREVLRAVEESGIREAVDLREVYEAHEPG
jgi:transcriptional regulator with XRE-family HTH domain